jgi:hypothetical protein
MLKIKMKNISNILYLIFAINIISNANLNTQTLIGTTKKQVPINITALLGNCAMSSAASYRLSVDNTDCGKTTPSGISTHDSGEVIKLTATEDDIVCCKFIYWVDRNEDSVTAENPLDVTIVRDTLLKAVFERKNVNIRFEVEGSGKVEMEPPTNVVCSTQKVLTATLSDC